MAAIDGPHPPEQLADQIIVRLAELEATVGTVESCTGGRVAAALTSVPGCSAAMLGGLVVYSNALKQALAGVTPGTLLEHGAVSRQCARELASGGARTLGADYVVAITGIAGPGGGTDEKPVGTVHFAWRQPGGSVNHECHQLFGDRANIQQQATRIALEGLLALVPE
jgi:PncC family amidohydrolase